MSNPETPLSLCLNTEVKFGTSGVRGPVSELTEKLCKGFAHAFLKSLCPKTRTLCIARDLRPSSPTIVTWIIEEARHLGIAIWDCGIISTPCLAFYGLQHHLPSIMVTGSHIPYDRNGIKFYLSSGEISKSDEQTILTTEIGNVSDKNELPPISNHHNQAAQLYKQRYLNAFPMLSLEGKRVGIYQHSSVARDALTDLIRSFGAETIPLERTEGFVALDTEAVSEKDQLKAKHWVKQHHLDAIVSTDGDGDRPLIADELGHWLRGDQVGMICCKHLQATHIVTPINSNTGLEVLLPQANVFRTKIGSPFVLEAMRHTNEQDISLGFEANGGVILGSPTHDLAALPTRDATLPILIFLAQMQHKPISSIVQLLPNRHTASERIQNISISASHALMDSLACSENWLPILQFVYPIQQPNIQSLDHLDGIRAYLSNHDILHIRVSGNANELRIYLESDHPAIAKSTCFEAKKALSSLFFDM